MPFTAHLSWIIFTIVLFVINLGSLLYKISKGNIAEILFAAFILVIAIFNIAFGVLSRKLYFERISSDTIEQRIMPEDMGKSTGNYDLMRFD